MLNSRKATSLLKGLFKTKLPAFSLLEMSLVLAIMGTVAGISMPMILEQRTHQKEHQTLQQTDMILTALGTYAVLHKSLPCPALDPTSGEPGPCTKDSPAQAVGYVPFKTLGISERASKDGFGHPLRYAVQPALTHRAYFFQSASGATPGLSVVDDQNKSVFNPAQTSDCLAVVILAEGAAFQQAKGEWETRNIGATLSYIDAPFSTNEKKPFRHLVKWVTRNNLITFYGKGSLPAFNETGRPNGVGSGFASVSDGAPMPPGTPLQNAMGPGSQTLAMDDADLGF